MKREGIRRFPVAISLALLTHASLLHAQQVSADVVVVVDTSTSISQPGMDHERTSLLVAKLLADIVPGKLVVIRSLDLKKDENWLPSKDTGATIPCSEDRSKTCHRVEPSSDWYHDVRVHQYGALQRPSRGDAGFKNQLNDHLAQAINNSYVGLGFRAAQGVFDSNGVSGEPRTVIWLSDGGADDEPQLESASRELKAAGVSVDAIVFGHGSTEVPNRLGLRTDQVRTPADLMKAFAESFRHIVDAPYRLDDVVASQPSFDVKPHVDEVWIVIYGNDTLGDVMVQSPDGNRRADYAQDKFAGAGAYKVLYAVSPPAGRWTVHANGGGPGLAYAVIQRSALQPVLLEPTSAVAGVPVTVVGGLAARGGAVLTPSDYPEPIAMTLEFGGKTIPLVDNGLNGDRTANDGRFSSLVTFDNPGEAEVTLHARSENLIDRTVKAKITVSGMFRNRGGPLTLDLGTVKAGKKACIDGTLNAEHQGAITFQLTAVQPAPAGETLDVEEPAGTLTVSGNRVVIRPGQPIRVCLSTTRGADAFEARGQEWLNLAAVGMTTPESDVPIRLQWRVQPLSFWERWGLFIEGLLLFLIIGIILYGYIKPERFQRNLALIFVPERAEIEEQMAQPLTQFKGIGIGWYRDARAYLHGNFRVSSKPTGALASLHALRRGTHVEPGGGGQLYWETSDFEWEPVDQNGRRATANDVFRIGEQGPYFRIAVKRGGVS